MAASADESSASSAASAAAPSLVPHEVLFGNPKHTQVRVSPDGRWFSYLAPSKDGVLNVWIARRAADGSLEADSLEMVTEDKKRGIRDHKWTWDARGLLYLQDFAGDENFHVFFVDLEAEVRTTRDMTPFLGVKATNLMLSKRHPEQILVGMNVRRREKFDMYRVDLRTGAVLLEAENDGDVIAWTTDADFQVRGCTATNPADGSTILRVRARGEDGAWKAWRELLLIPFLENGGMHGFTADGTGVVVESSLGHETTRLIELDAETSAERRAFAQHPECDVGAVMINPDTKLVEAVEFAYLCPSWTILSEDAALRGDLEALGRTMEGAWSVVSRSADDRIWIVADARPNGPTAYFQVERAALDEAPSASPRAPSIRFLLSDNPALGEWTLARVHPLVLAASDGLAMPSYLTVPPTHESAFERAWATASEATGIDAASAVATPRGAAVSGALRCDLGLPAVLVVHGGPWARDSFAYNPYAQWLASRGYLVLQVNYRGSSGFGKAHVNRGNVEWAKAMQQDLTDAVAWLTGSGLADRTRVGIFGGSYGGYAVLAGLAFTPELFRCGVDIVGPSHIKTLFQSVPPYWAPFKRQLVLRVGDVENDEELNRRISPVFHADKMRSPLLIIQGKNDPRVKQAESDQIATALRGHGIPVGYVIYDDEGHGLARPENRLDFVGRAEVFLRTHLGGAGFTEAERVRVAGSSAREA